MNNKLNFHCVKFFFQDPTETKSSTVLNIKSRPTLSVYNGCEHNSSGFLSDINETHQYRSEKFSTVH
jgi:hypothetical protein